ncbi:MAG: hypothetical protein OEM00_13505 [Burkholderiaceae bacterium]|nr:hypothetical protein [Burkholderiaceae bacterium]
MKQSIKAFAAAALALYCAAAAGDPGYYVVTAYSNPGLRTADFRYWTVKQPGSAEVIWPEIGLGWNVNGRWYTEVLASYIGSSKFATRLSTLNWQNDLLLTQGQYPFDLALHTLLVIPEKSTSANLFEFGPALQTDIGRTQVNANVFFERSMGAPSSKPTQLKYQWQLRYRWKPWLHFGAQGFGEPGPWDHWSPRDAQSHRLGPAVFGTLPAGAGSFAWQAAYLTGSTYAKHGKMFTMQVKYEF